VIGITFALAIIVI